MAIERLEDRDILLTFQEAAELLRVSRATMYRLINSGQLVGHKVGRGWRFYKTDLHRFVAGPRANSSTQLHAEVAVTLDEVAIS